MTKHWVDEEEDERISAWYELLNHPFFAEMWKVDPPEGLTLLEQVKAELDDAMHPKTVALPEVEETVGGYRIDGQFYTLERSADQYELDARAFEERARRQRAAARFVREREKAKDAENEKARNALNMLSAEVQSSASLIGSAAATAIVDAIENERKRLGR